MSIEKLFLGLKSQSRSLVATLGCLCLTLMSASCALFFSGDKVRVFLMIALYPLKSVVPDLEDNRFDRALDRIEHLSKNDGPPAREIQYTRGLVLILKARLSKRDDASRKTFLQGWNEMLRSAESGYGPAIEFKGRELYYGDLWVRKDRHASDEAWKEEQRVNFLSKISKYSAEWKILSGDILSRDSLSLPFVAPAD